MKKSLTTKDTKEHGGEREIGFTAEDAEESRRSRVIAEIAGIAGIGKPGKIQSGKSKTINHKGHEGTRRRAGDRIHRRGRRGMQRNTEGKSQARATAVHELRCARACGARKYSFLHLYGTVEARTLIRTKLSVRARLD